MIRTHIRIAHITSIRSGSPVDSRQCDWGISKIRIRISGMIHLDTVRQYPANMRRWHNVGLLLGQRRRRWANSTPTISQRPMFAGYAMHSTIITRVCVS